jgi:hypothetical protein
VTVPSEAPEKSRLADQVPLEHVAEPVASPERVTDRPFSEQVPDTEKVPKFTVLIADPAEGDVIATVGATVSFVKEREAWGASFPTPSL